MVLSKYFVILGMHVKHLHLSYSVPPELKQKGPIMVKVIAGNEAYLPCEATGVPKPRIIWQKANRILTKDSVGRFSVWCELNLA